MVILLKYIFYFEKFNLIFIKNKMFHFEVCIQILLFFLTPGDLISSSDRNQTGEVPNEKAPGFGQNTLSTTAIAGHAFFLGSSYARTKGLPLRSLQANFYFSAHLFNKLHHHISSQCDDRVEI